MSEITTIGVDLAKNVFQVHGVDASERVVVRKRLRRGQVLTWFAGIVAVPSWYGGLRDGALLGARTEGFGSRRSLDAAAICEGIRQTQQE